MPVSITDVTGMIVSKFGATVSNNLLATREFIRSIDAGGALINNLQGQYDYVLARPTNNPPGGGGQGPGPGDGGDGGGE